MERNRRRDGGTTVTFAALSDTRVSPQHNLSLSSHNVYLAKAF
jgi:hypothetical protein